MQNKIVSKRSIGSLLVYIQSFVICPREVWNQYWELGIDFARNRISVGIDQPLIIIVIIFEIAFNVLEKLHFCQKLLNFEDTKTLTKIISNTKKWVLINQNQRRVQISWYAYREVFQNFSFIVTLKTRDQEFGRSVVDGWVWIESSSASAIVTVKCQT